ncbi:MAG TPA: 50S ribosomal protein L11 methyltransferase [Bacteroidota bacterium]
MNHRRWTEITFRIPSSRQDLMTGQLAVLGFTGFLQTDDILSAYLPARLWTPAVQRQLQDCLRRFNNEFPNLDIAYSTNFVREENWNARWERTAGIIEATPRIIIKPSWKKLRGRDRGKIVLHIDPKMSFGTGHHETTRLCLVLLEQFAAKGAIVLDVGCGTGILSIAAVKLGARRVLAVDNDPWACVNARENVKRNRAKGIRVLKGDSSSIGKRPFNLILSNIDMPTNVKILPDLVRRIAPGGVLILSGMLATDLSGLLNTIERRNIVPVQVLEENEWVAIALAKL